MGKTSGFDLAGRRARRGAKGRFYDAGSPSVMRQFVATRFTSKRKHAVPSVGDRFGELTVTGYELASRGGLKFIVVQCSCGAPEHPVDPHNLFSGKSTRCFACAKKQSGAWNKKYNSYADACPDLQHRRRLLGRIGVIYGRCGYTKHAVYPDYGGRGIQIHEPWKKDRKAFLAYLVTLPGWDKPELEIDRIDNQGGYVPGNLRFADRTTQTRNRRRFRDLEQEITDLRHRLRRAEEQIHNCGFCGTTYRS